MAHGLRLAGVRVRDFSSRPLKPGFRFEPGERSQAKKEFRLLTFSAKSSLLSSNHRVGIVVIIDYMMRALCNRSRTCFLFPRGNPVFPREWRVVVRRSVDQGGSRSILSHVERAQARACVGFDRPSVFQAYEVRGSRG